MKEAWYSLTWYMAGAFFLVCSTARYFILSGNSNNQFVLYLFLGLGIIISFIYLLLISKHWKNHLKRWHIIYLLFVIANLIFLSFLLTLISESLFYKAFPVLLSFEVILFLSSFISEVHYQENFIKYSYTNDK